MDTATVCTTIDCTIAMLAKLDVEPVRKGLPATGNTVSPRGLCVSMTMSAASGTKASAWAAAKSVAWPTRRHTNSEFG